MKRTSVIHVLISVALCIAVGNGVAITIAAASKGMGVGTIAYGILTTAFTTAAGILNAACGKDDSRDK